MDSLIKHFEIEAMKEFLTPTLTQTVGNHIILWFKNSNQYIVVDKNLYSLIEVFLSSERKNAFYASLMQLGYDSSTSEKLFHEIDTFLDDCNQVKQPEIFTELAFKSDNRTFSHTYKIDNLFITVNYDSDNIRSLVHPQIEHLDTLTHQGETSVIFDMYQEDDMLCFFKNGTLLGSWPAKDYHLLQGKFAMHLLCSIHDNKEWDWLGTFHASTVVKNNQAAMIIGDSGKGKSTFTALLLANNFEVLADDLTPILAKDTLVYPYPGGISIKSGAFKILKSSLPNFDTLPEHYINPYKGYVKYVSAPKSKSYLTGYPCKIMVSINYQEKAATSLEPLAINEALLTLIPESWLAHDRYNSQQFLNWIKEVKFYQLSYSDSNDAIKVFSQLLKE